MLRRLREFLLDKGFARVCLADMASWLHCSKATLYGIAAGKKPLVAAVLGEFLSEAAVLAEQRTEHIAEPAKQLSAYLIAIGDEAGRMSPACYADVASDDVIGAIYSGHVDSLARRLHRRIDQGMRAGDFRLANARFLAEAAALITDANAQGDLPSRAGLTAADAQFQLSELMAATLSNTAYRQKGNEHARSTSGSGMVQANR